MATGRVNVGGGGGRLNIFTQLTEPSKKEGIWIKTNRAYKRAVVDESVFSGGEWIDRVAEGWPDLPANHSGRPSCTAGSDIYFATHDNGFYKLDTITKTYTQLPDLPSDVYRGAFFHFNGYIYSFGSTGNAGRSVYRYNISTEDFEQLSDLPTTRGTDQAANDIIDYENEAYITLGNIYLYKYIPMTDTYEQLAIIAGTGGSIVRVGQYIYKLGTNTSNTTTQRRFVRYSIADNEVETLQNLPYRHYNGAAVEMNSEIYVIGGEVASTRRKFYKYSVLNDSFSELDDIPQDFYNGSANVIGDKIFSIGTGPTNTTSINGFIEIYSMESKQYTNDDIIIVRTDDNTGTYKTELSSALPTLQGDKFTRLTTGFNDVYMYYDNDLHSLEAYYGDGTQWIKFKEAN